METKNVDVAIIGAGTAGMRVYREVARATESILLIESGVYGTTCARVGCMPSKLLIAAAEAAHFGAHTEPFGVTYGEPKIDGATVMRRVREERDRFVGFVVEDVESWPETHRVRGTATFKSDHTLSIDDEMEVTADRIVIATGSRPNIIPPFKEFGDRLITNDDIFYWQDLPQSVAVFGAGVIGIELGQALHRLGVRVTLFGRDHLVGPLTDPSLIKCATEIFTNEFEFHPHADVHRRANTGDGIEIEYLTTGAPKTASFDFALAATGRAPNVDGLKLENTSLELDERGVPLHDLFNGRCGESHIFIAGDANNRYPLLHEAADEGLIAGYNAANYPDVRRFKKSAPISIVFTDPQIMMVGQSFRELTDAGIDFEVGDVDWSDQGRSRVMLINKGILRVYGERNTGCFLGAEMIGPRAEHLAHLLAWAYQSHLTVTEMLERPYYHPVIEEGVRTALRNLNFALDMGPRPLPRCLDCGPGG